MTCVECGQGFDAKANGPLPTRCPQCAAERVRLNLIRRQAKYRASHLEQVREYDRLWKAADRQKPGYGERRRAASLRYKFGMSQAEYDAMVEQQGGKCAICRNGHCGSGGCLHVDHCHKTGTIRGLLCGKCNTAVGLLDDDPARAGSLAAYLRR